MKLDTIHTTKQVVRSIEFYIKDIKQEMKQKEPDITKLQTYASLLSVWSQTLIGHFKMDEVIEQKTPALSKLISECDIYERISDHNFANNKQISIDNFKYVCQDCEGNNLYELIGAE